MNERRDRGVWIIIAFAVVALAAGAALAPRVSGTQPIMAKTRDVAGDFALLGKGIDDVVVADGEGAPHQWRSFVGRPRALFFGFTHCAVICPLTVWQLNDALDRIGAPARDVDIQFITVDPARDTPNVLKSYFSGFNGRVKGYAGDEDATARIARAFSVVYRKAPGDAGDYTMDHTATVFLLNAEGRVVDVLAYEAPPETIEARLRSLVGATATTAAP